MQLTYMHGCSSMHTSYRILGLNRTGQGDSTAWDGLSPLAVGRARGRNDARLRSVKYEEGLLVSLDRNRRHTLLIRTK